MALRSRWADYAIFGADVRLEDGHEIEPLFPIGVDACCLVEVVDPARESERRMRHARCASAWPNLARSLLSQKGSTPAAEIVPVAGCTEAWLSSGAVDLGVDTYQTGKAVDDNGLRVTRRFRTVHSWMHRSTHSPPQLHPLISAFARWLHGSPEAVAAAARR